MPKRKNHITLNCRKPGYQTVIEGLHVGDTGSCDLIITLTDGSKPIDINSDEGIAAVMNVYKPDGVTSCNNCTVEDGKIVYALSEQDTACEGYVYYQLVVSSVDGDNDAVLYAAEFKAAVTKNVYAPTFTLLTEQPDDWSGYYQTYFRKQNNEYIPITDNTCPAFATNTFYRVENPQYPSIKQFNAFYESIARLDRLRKDINIRCNYATPQTYGAKGDGVTDDTEAIYKAIINNDVVYFPPGVYRTAGVIITNPEHPIVKNRGEANQMIEAAPRCPKTLIGAGRCSVLKPLDAKNYGFFCKRCGHVHRGEDLPGAEYRCPDCGSDRTYLVRIDSDAVLKIGRKIYAGDVVPEDYTDRVDECCVSNLTIEAFYTVPTSGSEVLPRPEEETEAVDGTDVNTETQAAEVVKEDTEKEKRHSRGLYLYGTHRTSVHNVLVLKAGYFGVDLTTNARDCQFTNIKVKYCSSHGISQGGYGNSFANVETSQNAMDGVNISRGGCQFTNVKTWANKRHGLGIYGAKHCMITNVNSQQNYGCGFKMCTGNSAGADISEPMYNEITGIQCVGNNFSGTIISTTAPTENPTTESPEDLNEELIEDLDEDSVEEADEESTDTTTEIADGTVKTLDGKNSAFCNGLEGSGFVIGGHHNVVRGSDVRAFWGKSWCAVEKYAVYFTEGAQDNEVELVCSEGTVPLAGIYRTAAFSALKFDQSDLLGTINAAYRNHCVINDELIRVSVLEMSAMTLVETNQATRDYQYLISARDSLQSNAALTISNGQFTLSGSPAISGGIENAVAKIPPVSLASASSTVGGSRYTGAYYAKNSEGQSVSVGYPLRVFYKVPIEQICPVGEPQKKKLYVKYTARIVHPPNSPSDTKWLIMPILRLQQRNGSAVVKQAFVNNTKENIQRDMISAATNNSREICYDIDPLHIDVKVIANNSSEDVVWTNCDLIFGLLKIASANEYNDDSVTVNDPDSIGFKIESLTFLATDGEAFPFSLDGFYSKSEVDAAHYTKVEIAALLGLTVDCTPLVFISGKYMTFENGSFKETTNASYRYCKTDVLPGEKFKINVYGGNAALAFIFYDSSGSLISGASNSGTGGDCFEGYFEVSGNNYSYNGIITAPDGAAYLVINDKKSAAELCYKLPSQAALGGGNT